MHSHSGGVVTGTLKPWLHPRYSTYTSTDRTIPADPVYTMVAVDRYLSLLTARGVTDTESTAVAIRLQGALALQTSLAARDVVINDHNSIEGHELHQRQSEILDLSLIHI